MAYHDFEDDLLPDDEELDELALDGEDFDHPGVTFEQIRHGFDQMFESNVIHDIESPEIIARWMEAHRHFIRV